MNQIAKNVKSLLEKDFIDTDQKLILFYLKQFEGLRMDSKVVSMQDLLNIDFSLVQAIIDAKEILKLMEDDEE